MHVAASMGLCFSSANSNQNIENIDFTVIEEICKRFNQSLIFEPEAESEFVCNYFFS